LRCTTEKRRRKMRRMGACEMSALKVRLDHDLVGGPSVPRRASAPARRRSQSHRQTRALARVVTRTPHLTGCEIKELNTRSAKGPSSRALKGRSGCATDLARRRRRSLRSSRVRRPSSARARPSSSLESLALASAASSLLASSSSDEASHSRLRRSSPNRPLGRGRVAGGGGLRRCLEPLASGWTAAGAGTKATDR